MHRDSGPPYPYPRHLLPPLAYLLPSLPSSEAAGPVPLAGASLLSTHICASNLIGQHMHRDNGVAAGSETGLIAPEDSGGGGSNGGGGGRLTLPLGTQNATWNNGSHLHVMSAPQPLPPKLSLS